MPPPSWTGISSPTSARIALTAASLTGLAGEGAVQVDQVQAARAGVEPAPRHRRGVVAEDRRLVHVALAKANAVPSFRSIAGISSMAEARAR
jgi:hypothetical protein